MKDLSELVQVLHEQIEDLSLKACCCGTSSCPQLSGESSYELAPVAKEEEDLEYAEGDADVEGDLVRRASASFVS